jgi:flagellar motor component MotA
MEEFPSFNHDFVSKSFKDLGEIWIAQAREAALKHAEYIKDLYAVITLALSSSIKARREGLLALEGAVDEDKVTNRDIFYYGLRFVIDGTDYTVIDKLLSNLINQEKDKYLITLKTIQKEAVLAIQSGDNPRHILHMLCSYTDILPSDPALMKIMEEEGY